MAEYIEREALIAFLEDVHEDKNWLVNQYNADWICSWIESQPAADVVEIPCRCEECQFAISCETDHPCHPVREYLYCTDRSDEVKPDGFCSYGERRAE